MAKKKKRPAVLDSSDIINSSEHHPMLILDTDTTHFQKQPFTSANTPRPPRAIITEHVEPRNEQHSHSSERAPESLDSEFIADTEKTRTQRAQLLAEYSENFTLVARLLMAKEADIRIGSVCVCNQA
ncbi:hypothetical protein F5880DRAFT_1512619, partial [Lentinula raphanica]